MLKLRIDVEPVASLHGGRRVWPWPWMGEPGTPESDLRAARVETDSGGARGGGGGGEAAEIREGRRGARRRGRGMAPAGARGDEVAVDSGDGKSRNPSWALLVWSGASGRTGEGEGSRSEEHTSELQSR